MVAVAVTEAPWFDGGESHAEAVGMVAGLPPALVDWLWGRIEDLSDLSAGN